MPSGSVENASWANALTIGFNRGSSTPTDFTRDAGFECPPRDMRTALSASVTVVRTACFTYPKVFTRLTENTRLSLQYRDAQTSSIRPWHAVLSRPRWILFASSPTPPSSAAGPGSSASGPVCGFVARANGSHPHFAPPWFKRLRWAP